MSTGGLKNKTDEYFRSCTMLQANWSFFMTVLSRLSVSTGFLQVITSCPSQISMSKTQLPATAKNTIKMHTTEQSVF